MKDREEHQRAPQRTVFGLTTAGGEAWRRSLLLAGREREGDDGRGSQLLGGPEERARCKELGWTARTITAGRPHERARPEPGQRSLGYVVAIAVNVALLYLINKSPGWQAVGFLTSETSSVIGVVNTSIAAGVVMNGVYLVNDPAWLRALGDVITTAISVVALLAIWQVWPVDLAAPGELLARWVIGVGVAGSAIAIIVAVVRFVRALSGSPSTGEDSPSPTAPTHHA